MKIAILQAVDSLYTAGVNRLPRFLLARAALSACLLVPACGPVEPSYVDPTPAARLGAIRETAQSGRTEDIKELIVNLASDDSSVRFAAISALQRLTGETNGYRFNDPWETRALGISAWKAWLAKQPAPAPAPALEPAPAQSGV